MYKTQRMTSTIAGRDPGYEGETIEQKINRIVNNKEPITDGAPLIYTERKAGVMPAYNIRTDRFEIAVEAMDKVTKTEIAKRELRQAERKEKVEVKTEVKTEVRSDIPTPPLP